MQILTIRRMPGLAALMLAAAFFTAGQSAGRPDFNRTSNYDVQNYLLKVSFDRPAKAVHGDTTVTLTPTVVGLQKVVLDAVGLKFSSVRTDPSGVDLEFHTTRTSVEVILDRSYSPGEMIRINFRYTAVPAKGIYFVDEVTGNDGINHSAQIWTQGEPDEARHWFPSFDFPSDKATSEEYITAEAGETVVGNGELLEKLDNGDGTTTWHYRMPVPHSTYLTSFVIGKYSRLDLDHDKLPMAAYVYPGHEKTGRNAFSQTADMIPVYERLTGVKFPFNKYDQTMVASFQFGGMENITATTMADTEIFWGDFEFGKPLVTDLVSHELAHSWFGNMVTCRNWAELWLNEGFATYMEAAYREAKFGHEDYIRKINSDAREFLSSDATTKRRYGLYNLLAADVDKLFDDAAVTYNKGGVVLHMLRETVGTEDFWKGVNIYLTRHRFASVESSDLKAAMEEASGQDLGWFFDQWVYSSGAPRLTIHPVYRSKTRTLKLTVTQTQPLSPNVPQAFILPLDIAIKSGTRTAVRQVKVSRRVETLTITGVARPNGITVDPEQRIPAKTVKLLPITFSK